MYHTCLEYLPQRLAAIYATYIRVPSGQEETHKTAPSVVCFLSPPDTAAANSGQRCIIAEASRLSASVDEEQHALSRGCGGRC